MSVVDVDFCCFFLVVIIVNWFFCVLLKVIIGIYGVFDVIVVFLLVKWLWSFKIKFIGDNSFFVFVVGYIFV